MRTDLWEKFGASEGIRTLDVHLGKVMLYQTELRSLPKKWGNRSATTSLCKSLLLHLYPHRAPPFPQYYLFPSATMWFPTQPKRGQRIFLNLDASSLWLRAHVRLFHSLCEGSTLTFYLARISMP